MRTLIFIAVGLVLAAVMVRLTPAGHRVMSAGLFTLAWLAVSAWNLRTGMAHGYSLTEELPVHVALFGIPTALAWGICRWSRH